MYRGYLDVVCYNKTAMIFYEKMGLKKYPKLKIIMIRKVAFMTPMFI